ncbi:MAG: CopD family protein [Sulfuritalea sp.]|nr:CopD family protein [Sulfuritalea sp.]
MRIAVLIHLLGVVVWVGGMFFAHVCLRPVAAAQLPPPQRLPLLAAVLGRFFAAVGVAVVAILITGLLRFGELGAAATPWRWHAMAATGSAMMLIYLLIVLRYYPRLKAAVAAQTWPAGGAAMDAIRKLVLLNLVLGVVTIAIALAGP